VARKAAPEPYSEATIGEVTDDDLNFHLSLVGKYYEEMEEARLHEGKRSMRVKDIDSRRAEITKQRKADVTEALEDHDASLQRINARAQRMWKRLKRVWWWGTVVFILGLGAFFRFQIVRAQADTRGSLNLALGRVVSCSLRERVVEPSVLEMSARLSDSISTFAFDLVAGNYVNATDWSLPSNFNYSNIDYNYPSPPPPFPPDRAVKPPPPSPRPPGFEHPPPNPSPPPPTWCEPGEGNCVAPPPSPSPPPPS